jgi:uncharacterized iron-regulated protein
MRRLARLTAVALGLLAGFVLLAGCASERWAGRYGADNPLAGTIYDVAANRYLNEPELLARLADLDFVLLGQTPGNADQAVLSARVIRQLAGEGRRLTAVAFESLPTDEQPLIVEYLAAHPGDAAGLDRALESAVPDRPHLAQFAPALSAAVAAGAQVVAADLSADTLRAVLTHGFKALQPDFVRRTGLLEPFATPVEQGLKEELATAACERATSRALDALVAARRARDATMADRLAAVTGRGQGLLVAPPGHVRNDRGVPWYLRQLRPGARVASLALVELTDATTRPGDLPYDYVWFTPATQPPAPPPCRVPRPKPAPDKREVPDGTEALLLPDAGDRGPARG